MELTLADLQTPIPTTMEERITQLSDYAKREEARFSVNTAESTIRISPFFKFLLQKYRNESVSKEETEAINNIERHVNDRLSKTTGMRTTQQKSMGTARSYRPQSSVRDTLAPYSTLTQSMKGCEDTPGGCATMGGKTRRNKRRRYKSRRYTSRR